MKKDSRKCVGFTLIKKYPGCRKELGYFERYTTGEFFNYPGVWQPIYEGDNHIPSELYVGVDAPDFYGLCYFVAKNYSALNNRTYIAADLKSEITKTSITYKGENTLTPARLGHHTGQVQVADNLKISEDAIFYCLVWCFVKKRAGFYTTDLTTDIETIALLKDRGFELKPSVLLEISQILGLEKHNLDRIKYLKEIMPVNQ